MSVPRGLDGARWALAALLTLGAAGPSAYLLACALPMLGEGGWLQHFTTTVLGDQARTSARLVAEAALVAFAVGAVPAVVVARHDFAGRRLLSVLMLLPLLFAPHVSAGLWTVGLGHRFFETPQALSLALGLASAPYLFVVFRIAAARMPRAYAELAAALGHGRAARWRRVHLPYFAVPVAAGLMIVTAQAVGDYAAAERMGIQTLSVGLHNLWFASQSSTVAAIIASLMIVPAALLVVAAAWSSTALLSQPPVAPAAAAAARRPLPRAAAAALWTGCLAASLPAFVVPEFLTWRWALRTWSRTRFADIAGDLAQSALTAAATAATVLVVGLALAAVLRAGSRSRHAERLPWLFLLNYFLPSLVLALAFVMMSRDGAVGAALLGEARDTRLLIVAAAALRLMPFALLPLLDALRRTPPAMIEAARACGRGPVAARATAFAGHVAPALALGAALVFLEGVKELDLSLTLQPFGYHSLALKIYAFSRNQNMDRAAVWVLLSQLLMLAPLALLAWRMDRLDTAARR